MPDVNENEVPALGSIIRRSRPPSASASAAAGSAKGSEGAAGGKSTGGGEGDEKHRKMRQFFKIAMPHVSLYLLLCLYLLAGAWAFARIEHNAEREQQAKKLERIAEIYEQIASSMGEECGLWANERLSAEDRLQFREGIYASLGRVSQFFEGRQFRVSAAKEPDLEEILPPRWNAMSSILYALSILTTTGYGSATPMTPLGQWLSIGYGLLGIPLTVLAAVDIGRFLSDVVLACYDRILRAFKRLSVLCGFRQRTGQVISQVETKALKSLNLLHHTKPMIAFTNKTKKKGARRSNNNGNGNEKEGQKKKLMVAKEEDVGKKGGKRRLPLSVNAAILLLFCMLGGVVYMAAGGSERNFIEGFFVTFNLVANLTMSEIPTDFDHLMTLVYILVFVTFGLAVLSMCADLAASELKWVFLKIHYFGRKINWSKRRAAKKQQQEMEFEVKELLKLIDQIRARYPEKEDISSLDILKYVQELNGGSFNGPYGGGAWPYRTFNMWLLQHHRRNTLAFMPQSFEALKFADEMDQEEEQLLNSTVNALLMNFRKQRGGSEQNTFIPLLPFSV